jgi:hypothetical protein
MDGDCGDVGPDETAGPSESLSSDDVPQDDGNTVVDAAGRWISVAEHQERTHTDWHNSGISRDIDALVQLKLLRKAL